MQYPTPAARPRNSVLSTKHDSETFAIEPRSWRDGLSEVVRELVAPG
jgi:dTDP-4-dehydrorhamnose reductase